MIFSPAKMSDPGFFYILNYCFDGKQTQDLRLRAKTPTVSLPKLKVMVHNIISKSDKVRIQDTDFNALNTKQCKIIVSLPVSLLTY